MCSLKGPSCIFLFSGIGGLCWWFDNGILRMVDLDRPIQQHSPIKGHGNLSSRKGFKLNKCKTCRVAIVSCHPAERHASTGREEFNKMIWGDLGVEISNINSPGNLFCFLGVYGCRSTRSRCRLIHNRFRSGCRNNNSRYERHALWS